jgi:DNA-binding NarL/FixJ family response regulator
VGGKGAVVVAIVDPAERDFLATRLEQAGFATHAVATGQEVLSAASEGISDLVVFDLDLPDMTGYELCYELRERYGTELPIILLSGDRTESSDRVAGLLIGADDFVTKPADADEVLVRARRLLARLPAAEIGRELPLTGRENEILRLLADGRTQEDIASDLFISPKTVGTHIQRILSKLGVHSRTEAVAIAYRYGVAGNGDGER